MIKEQLHMDSDRSIDDDGRPRVIEEISDWRSSELEPQENTERHPAPKGLLPETEILIGKVDIPTETQHTPEITGDLEKLKKGIKIVVGGIRKLLIPYCSGI